MIDLAYYIYILLNNYECVVIPGLGGFITRKKSALIHATQNLFIPPSKHLIFNGQLVHNDGLLAHFIACDNQISYETAINKIENAVNDILFRLYKGENVFFTNIGALTFQNGLLKFEAAQGLDIQDESYGLNSFMMPLLQTEKRRPVRTKATKKPVKPYQVAAVITFLILGLATWLFYTNPVQDCMRSNVVPKIFNIMVNISDSFKKEPAVSDFMLSNDEIVSFIPDSEIFDKEQLFVKPEDIITFVPEYPDVPDTAATAAVTEDVGESIEKHIDIEAISVLCSPEEGRYYVIIGSFQKFSLADNLYKEIMAKGFFQAEILDVPGSSYRRVSLQSFDTYREAKSCLDEVQDQMQGDAWIMKGKSL